MTHLRVIAVWTAGRYQRRHDQCGSDSATVGGSKRDERGRRSFAASEVRAAGRRGLAAVSWPMVQTTKDALVITPASRWLGIVLEYLNSVAPLRIAIDVPCRVTEGEIVFFGQDSKSCRHLSTYSNQSGTSDSFRKGFFSESLSVSLILLLRKVAEK